MKKTFNNTASKTTGLREMFHPRTAVSTGMDIVEAMEIIINMSRELEFDEKYNWNEDNSEAIGVVDALLSSLREEVE